MYKKGATFWDILLFNKIHVYIIACADIKLATLRQSKVLVAGSTLDVRRLERGPSGRDER